MSGKSVSPSGSTSDQADETNKIVVFHTNDQKTTSVEEPGQKSKRDEVFVESNAGDGTRREEQYMTGYKLVICIVSLLLSMFLTSIDQTIVVTIISEIGNKFDAFDKINWLSSGFLLAICVVTTIWGRISIIVGRKLTLSIAIIIFEVGSLICALSTNMNMLIGGRVLAGIGGGGIQSLVYAIISEILPVQRRTFGMILIALTFSTASVIGPLIGGALSKVSWRWCFYINLPVGGVAFAFLQYAFNPPSPKGKILPKFKTVDFIGVAMLAIGLVLFLLAFSFGSSSQFKWGSAAVICTLIFGVLFLAIFLIWNLRFSKYPLLAPDIITDFYCIISVLTITATFGYVIINQLYISVYFQVIHGYDAWHSGVHLLPMIIASVITSILCGGAFPRASSVKPFSIFAGVCGLVGNSILMLLGVNSTLGQIIGFLILPGISTGMQMQSCIMLFTLSLPKTPGSTIMGTTFFTFGTSIGGSLGADLATLTYTESLKSILTSAMKSETNQAVLQELSNVNINTILVNTSLIKELTPETQYFIKTQVMKAIRNVYHLSAGLAAIALIASLFQNNKAIPKESKSSEEIEIKSEQQKKAQREGGIVQDKTDENEKEKSVDEN
ncbi:major facilitator superfamily domain-containing protein [Scheffersomyces coipomensis]|uniref:major facilitator superfamily domain-containing protein n=1 Tax=Scheffersomyces coipomensis TaxID=1788519 RepID=UPI00315D5DC9